MNSQLTNGDFQSSVCTRIIERLGMAHKRRVVAISQDSFYRDLTEEESKRADRGDFNFDHPGNSTTFSEFF